MDKQVPEITFCIYFNNHEKIHEEKIPSDKLARKRIKAMSVLEGCICIKFGEAQFLIEDEITPWIQNLCLKPIPFLINGDNASIYYFSREGALNIINNKDQLIFEDNFNSPLSLAFEATITALTDCAARFIKLMIPLKKDDPAFMNAIKSLKLLQTMAEDSMVIRK